MRYDLTAGSCYSEAEPCDFERRAGHEPTAHHPHRVACCRCSWRLAVRRSLRGRWRWSRRSHSPHLGANWPTMRGRLANPGLDREECRGGGPSTGRREGGRLKTSGHTSGPPAPGNVPSWNPPRCRTSHTGRGRGVPHAPIVYVHCVLDAPAIPHPGPITAWDPITRLLTIGGRVCRGGPLVSVFGAPGTLVMASGHQEDSSVRWIGTTTSRSTEWRPGT